MQCGPCARERQAHQCGSAGTRAIEQFLTDKGRADAAGADAQALVAALHSLTGLRALLAAGLSSGARPGRACVLKQQGSFARMVLCASCWPVQPVASRVHSPGVLSAVQRGAAFQHRLLCRPAE